MLTAKDKLIAKGYEFNTLNIVVTHRFKRQHSIINIWLNDETVNLYEVPFEDIQLVVEYVKELKKSGGTKK